MMVSLIVAMGKNRVIGNKGKMLWHLPLEFKHFKQTTMGHHLIMGRKCFESIGGKPLPGRPHIIISRNKNYPALGCTVVSDLEEAISIAKKAGDTECFIAGGGEIYKWALEKKLVEKIYLTTVDFNEAGDTYFPEIDSLKWKLVSTYRETVSEENNLAWVVSVLEKIKD